MYFRSRIWGESFIFKSDTNVWQEFGKPGKKKSQRKVNFSPKPWWFWLSGTRAEFTVAFQESAPTLNSWKGIKNWQGLKREWACLWLTSPIHNFWSYWLAVARTGLAIVGQSFSASMLLLIWYAVYDQLQDIQRKDPLTEEGLFCYQDIRAMQTRDVYFWTPVAFGVSVPRCTLAPFTHLRELCVCHT